MRSRLFCDRPACDAQCGWVISYPWDDWGQDPPEAELYDEELVDEQGRCYCSQECMDAMKPELDEIEAFDEMCEEASNAAS